jgi:pyruvate/2-oxoglutarate dehydrogenase complex dihydrolipoamide dehydrogenase (E3) component
MGVEFAQMFGRFGVKVSLIEAQPNLLPHDDPELTQILETILTEEGIDLHLQAQLTAVQSTPEGKQLTLRYENDYEQSFIVDEILITVGRKPSLTVLKPEVVGIKLNDDGWIKVDDTFCTNVPISGPLVISGLVQNLPM